jgi:DNA-binding transcriptional LysR family regulator
VKRKSICNLDVSALRALLVLREHGSFARVSEKIHLSASAVFCQIRQLEDQLGQKLYERLGKTLQLTASGHSLANYAERIVQMHDSTLSEFKLGGSGLRDSLRLGCGPHGSAAMLPHLILAFVKQFPRAEIQMISADDNTMLNDLRSGFLDALLMSLSEDVEGLGHTHLWSYELVLVFPPLKSGLFKKPTVEDLRKAPFILYHRPVLIDAAYQKLCRDLGYEPNVVMQNDELDSIKELIMLGSGVSLLPIWAVAHEARKGKVRVVHLPKRQLYKYGLLYRNSVQEGSTIANLITVAQQWKQWWPLATYVAATTKSLD